MSKGDDLFFMILVFISATVFSFFYGHEFGMVNGSKLQRESDSGQLKSCQPTLAGSLYAR